MREKKQTLRARVSFQRESLSLGDLVAWSILIQRRAVALAPYLRAQNVALYSPSGNEVLTAAIAEDAIRAGKTLFYPRMMGRRRLELLRVSSPEELRPGAYGILEPSHGLAINIEAPPTMVVFVPGVAFDLHGNRLGRGQGAYDWLLEKLGSGAQFIALAYEFQILGEVPVGVWDRPVHYIVTERRVIECFNPDPVPLN
jgi:5-formyltetrahydrofolate cyclo-ligase